MEEFVLYILFSEKFNKTYVGFTSDLISRFKSHDTLSNQGYTKNYRPWKVIYVEFFETKERAMAKEKFFKSGRGRLQMKRLIDEGSYPSKA